MKPLTKIKIEFFFRRLWVPLQDWWGNFDSYKNYYIPKWYRNGEKEYQKFFWKFYNQKKEEG